MKKFVWLDSEKHPDIQRTRTTTFAQDDGDKFACVGFKKTMTFEKPVKNVVLKVFADTEYQLYANGEFVGAGPVCPGGDYGNTEPPTVQYYSTYELCDIKSKLEIYVRVLKTVYVQCRVSSGRGGLWVRGSVIFEDGSVSELETDETWLARVETNYKSPTEIDFCENKSEWESACETASVWKLLPSPIKELEEKRISPLRTEKISDDEIIVFFDKIYAAYPCIELGGSGRVKISPSETGGRVRCEHILTFDGDVHYRSFRLESVGQLRLEGIKTADIKDVYIMASHYPIPAPGHFRCSDEMLNKIYDVGRHTVDICRQSIELDSPSHQENLGCVGDYYIESLVAYYCFGDTSLSRFDLLRIADYMRMTDGKMFHTSYSLIWVYMLYDNYMYSGDITVLKDTLDVLEMLLARFDSYIGESGVLENVPDYMFIDWIPVEEYNLHHPPRALGQSSLCAFYYHALTVSADIFNAVGMQPRSRDCIDRAARFKSAFNDCFYDKQRKLYCGGMNTPGAVNRWQPENSEKRYFIAHPNILAALYGLSDDGAALVERVINDTELYNVQPYFMHFVLEAIYKTGLFAKYGLREIHKWDDAVLQCDMGMKEAWGDFPGYRYDYSHGWGATPSYQLPSKISGLEILEPGFKSISVSPCLFGLDFAEISIPTPFGDIYISLSDEIKTEIPDGIKLSAI